MKGVITDSVFSLDRTIRVDIGLGEEIDGSKQERRKGEKKKDEWWTGSLRIQIGTQKFK